MSRVLVVSDDGRTTVEVTMDDEGAAAGLCAGCGERISDRGHFEDTVQASENHLDNRH